MSDAATSSRGSLGPQPSPPSRRRFRARPVIALLLLLVLAYLASPYVSFWLFTRALQANDRDALESYVDFPSVRQSLKQELRARLPKAPPDQRKQDDAFSGLAARLAPSLIDQLVDAFVTPEGLAALISNPDLARDAKAKDPAALAKIQTEKRDLNWSRVRYAFFTGLREFVVDVDAIKLRFEFTGLRWRLTAVQLPPSE